MSLSVLQPEGEFSLWEKKAFKIAINTLLICLYDYFIAQHLKDVGLREKVSFSCFFSGLLSYMVNFWTEVCHQYGCKALHKLRYFQIFRLQDELFTDIVKSKMVSLNNSSYILRSFIM